MSSFWDQKIKKLGLVHYMRYAKSPTDTLVILIHGYSGDPAKTWGNLMSWVIGDGRSFDPDVFSYAYAWKYWQRSSIEEAAGGLLDWQPNWVRYRHLILITHSTGALVAKELIRLEQLRLEEQGTKQGSIPQDRGAIARFMPVTCRIRRIINYAGAHAGASDDAIRGLNGTKVLNKGIVGISRAPVLRFVVPLVNSRIGENKILQQLQDKGYLEQLEDDFIGNMRRLQDADLPRPVSVDFPAAADSVVKPFRRKFDLLQVGTKPWSLPEDVVTEVDGSHLEGKLPSSPEDPSIPELRGWVERYLMDPALEMAHGAVRYSFEVDREDELKEIRTGLTKEEGGPLERAQLGSQVSVRESLDALCYDTNPGRRRVLVTGDAGVGKSVVLRRLIRRLFVRYLARHHADQEPLPMYLPLRDMAKTVNDAAAAGELTGEVLWGLIRRHWIEYANGYIDRRGKFEHSNMMTADWFDRALAERSPVMVLDGIDELIYDCRGLNEERFLEAVKTLERTAGTKRLKLILGCRFTQFGIATLSQGCDPIYQVQPLTEEEAEVLFPAVKKLCGHLDPRVKKLVLTPLILLALGSRIEGQFDDPRMRTRSGVMEFALEAIILRSMGDRDTDLCLNALAIAGWIMYQERLPIASRTELLGHLETLRLAWEDHLTGTGQDPSAGGLMPAFTDLREQISLSSEGEPDHRPDLFSRTIFFPVVTSFELRHIEWEDYLASRYLTFCIRYSFARSFYPRSILNAMFDTTGELLNRIHSRSRISIGRPYLDACLRFYDEKREDIIMANATVFLGKTVVEVDPNVVRGLFDHLLSPGDRPREVARHVALNSLSFRALKPPAATGETHPRLGLDEIDPWSPRIRAPLREILSDLLDGRRCPELNPWTKCLVWFFSSALEQTLPLRPWPGLGDTGDPETDRRQNEAMLDLLTATGEDGHRHCENRIQQTLQISWAEIQFDVIADRVTPISGALFLYPVMLVRQANAIHPDADKRLRRLFEKEADLLERPYRRSRLMCRILFHNPTAPELFARARGIYDRCRAMFAGG
jgi:hypothetical protein